MSIFTKGINKVQSFILSLISESRIRVEAAMRGGSSYTSKIIKQANSLRTQTHAKWKTAVESAVDLEQPDYQALEELYDSLKTDNHLMGIIESRVLKTAYAPFRIINKKTGEEDEVMTKLFKKNWFYNFIKLVIWSRFRGCKVIEVFETTEDGEINTVTDIPKAHINPFKKIIKKNPSDTTGWEYSEGNMATYFIQVGEDEDIGILADVAIDAINKKIAKGSWLEFIEKFGIPPRWATTDSMDDARQQELAEMMEAMISAHWAVLRGNETIESLKATTTDAFEVFDKLIERMNSEMSKRILGGTATTEQNSFVGSTEAHQNSANLRHLSDAEFASAYINELFKKLPKIGTAYKFLENYSFEWDMSVELSVEQLIDGVSKLGDYFDFDLQKLAKMTGLPIVGIKKLEETEPKKKEQPKQSLTARLLAMYPKEKTTETVSAIGTELQSIFDKLIKSVFDKKITASVPADLLLITTEHLNSVLTAEVPISKGSIGMRDAAFHAHLRNNLFKFGAAKTFAQFKELSELLTDSDGNARKWQDFKDDALALHKNYNQNWLLTEFNTARQTARNARMWRTYEEEAELYDLQFDTAKDAKVRQHHADLHGITKPVNDEFWDSYTPPLDWNCRCVLRQVGKGTPITPNSVLKDIETVTLQFAFNAGKERMIFNNEHPYFENINNQTLRALDAIKDYGLKAAADINLKKLEDFTGELKTKEEAQDYWNALKGEGDDFVLQTFAGLHVRVTDANVKKLLAEGKWTWVDSVMNTINAPSEIYEDNNGIYTLVKFYKTNRFVIQLKLNDDSIELIDAFNPSKNEIDGWRKGILHYVKK